MPQMLQRFWLLWIKSKAVSQIWGAFPGRHQLKTWTSPAPHPRHILFMLIYGAFNPLHQVLLCVPTLQCISYHGNGEAPGGWGQLNWLTQEVILCNGWILCLSICINIYIIIIHTFISYILYYNNYKYTNIYNYEIQDFREILIT